LSVAITDTITKVYSSLDKAVFGVSVDPVVKSNVEADVSGSFLTIYSSGRYEIWKGVSDLISQKPLLGFGMEKIGHYHSSGHPHNIVIEVAFIQAFLAWQLSLCPFVV